MDQAFRTAKKMTANVPDTLEGARAFLKKNNIPSSFLDKAIKIATPIGKMANATGMANIDIDDMTAKAKKLKDDVPLYNTSNSKQNNKKSRTDLSRFD